MSIQSEERQSQGTHLSLCSSCGQTDKAGLLDHGLGGDEADVTLGQHLLGEADLAGAVEDGVAQHLGLSHRAGVADLEGAAWAAGAHGLLVGEPLDGRGGEGGALLDGAVHPVGVGHGEEGGVDALGGGLDVGEPHPVVVAAESALVSSGKDGLVHHVQGLAVVDHPVGGCVHGEDAASPADRDAAFQEVGDLVRHHFHRDHSLLSSLCLDGERSGGAGVAGCWLLNDDLVVLREDHDVLGVVLLLGQDGVRVPLGAVSSDHVVAVVQLVAGGIRCLWDKKRW